MADAENKRAENETASGAPKPLFSLGDTSQLVAITVVMCYVSGFIIVVAYLGSFGIKDYDAFRTQYIISGATLLLLAGLYYYFVGRFIVSINDDTKESQQTFAKHGATGKLWGFAAFTFPMCRLGFNIAVTSFIGSSLLFDITSTRLAPLVIPMVAGFYWIDNVLTSKASESIGKIFWLLTEVFCLTAFVVFYYLADGIILSFTKFVLVATGAGIVYVGATHSVKQERARKELSVYFFVFAVVASSGTFGQYFYGHIRTSIGGGEPVEVKVVVSNDTPKELQDELKVSDSKSATVRLIAETSTELFLGFPSNDSTQGYRTVIRVDKGLVKGVISNDVSVIKYLKQQ